MNNGDSNNNPAFILVISVILLLGGSFSLVITFVKEFNLLVLMVGCVLAVCGACLVVFGIVRIFQISAYKKVMDNVHAHVTNARFESANFSSYSASSYGRYRRRKLAHLSVYSKIKYSYFDENGVFRKVNSTLSYSHNQVEYLQQKGNFKIKCNGKTSVIIEPIPEHQDIYNAEFM